MFNRVCVANRGEIARRVFRTLSSQGISSAAIYTAADTESLHVREADVSVEVSSYLDPHAVVTAAVRAGADAVHPGYGFLSENPAFARAVIDAGLAWIGPPPEAIDAMGDKIRAKATVASAGVPVVPGASGVGLSDAQIVDAALEVGLPVLLKPSAGGGGKGMRRVTDKASLSSEVASARREASSAFGDDTLLVERWVSRPRHIEVQVFADKHGGAVYLGERECSLQRRHQKIVEEAPSPLLDDATRKAIGASAVGAARACGYVGAGTVEFIVSADRPDEFFFMEMNTRLQVEHPVTEMVTGLDLVEWQLKVAAGEPLPLTQDEVRISGAAVEARVYAEDPERGFLPAAGHVLALREPHGGGVRVDSSLAAGTVVGTSFDPMLSKVIAYGADRPAALRSLRRALSFTDVIGVTTNTFFLRELLAFPAVVAGELDTELVERFIESDRSTGQDEDEGHLVAAALVGRQLLSSTGDGPWDSTFGWRLGGVAETEFPVVVPGHGVTRINVLGPSDDAVVRIGDGSPRRVSAHFDRAPDVEFAAGVEGGMLRVTTGHAVSPAPARAVSPAPASAAQRSGSAVTTQWVWAADGDDVWVGTGGRCWKISADPALAAQEEAGAGAGGPVVSPMPGTVLSVAVSAGDTVTAGQQIAVVEAMKMEHSVTAQVDGVVSSVSVRAGDSVALDQVLAVIDSE